MTSKCINNFQTISLRPQNDLEKLVIQNIHALLLSGKEPHISFTDENDMIIEIKSKKTEKKGDK